MCTKTSKTEWKNGNDKSGGLPMNDHVLRITWDDLTTDDVILLINNSYLSVHLKVQQNLTSWLTMVFGAANTR